MDTNNIELELELDNLGGKIVRDAKRNALPNKKTGKLDRSFKASTEFNSIDDFSVIVSEQHYGVYLNAKTNYMDKAIKDNIDNGINKIVDELTNGIVDVIINKK